MIDYSEMHLHLINIQEFIESNYCKLPIRPYKFLMEAQENNKSWWTKLMDWILKMFKFTNSKVEQNTQTIVQKSENIKKLDSQINTLNQEIESIKSKDSQAEEKIKKIEIDFNNLKENKPTEKISEETKSKLQQGTENINKNKTALETTIEKLNNLKIPEITFGKDDDQQILNKRNFKEIKIDQLIEDSIYKEQIENKSYNNIINGAKIYIQLYISYYELMLKTKNIKLDESNKSITTYYFNNFRSLAFLLIKSLINYIFNLIRIKLFNFNKESKQNIKINLPEKILIWEDSNQPNIYTKIDNVDDGTWAKKYIREKNINIKDYIKSHFSSFPTSEIILSSKTTKNNIKYITKINDAENLLNEFKESIDMQSNIQGESLLDQIGIENKYRKENIIEANLKSLINFSVIISNLQNLFNNLDIEFSNILVNAKSNEAIKKNEIKNYLSNN